MPERPFSAVLVGDESLLIRCAGLLLERGHPVRRIVSAQPEIVGWAATAGVSVSPNIDDLLADPPEPFDHLFSVAYLKILPDDALRLPRGGAFNFHDGPLPEFAGLNATTWALMEGLTSYRIHWHVIETGLDTGDIVITSEIAIDEAETSFSLNAKCYEAGLDGFALLVDQLSSDTIVRDAQLGERRVYRRSHRPPSGGLLLPSMSAADQVRMIRALDFGRYDNPVGLPRLPIVDNIFVTQAAVAVENEKPAADVRTAGMVVGVDASSVLVSTSNGVVEYQEAIDESGKPVSLPEFFRAQGLGVGDSLDPFGAGEIEEFVRLDRAAIQTEHECTKSFRAPIPIEPPLTRDSEASNGSDTGTECLVSSIATGTAPQGSQENETSRPDVAAETSRLDIAGALAVFVGLMSDQRVFDIGFRSLDNPQTALDSAFDFEIPIRIDLINRNQSIREACAAAGGKFARVEPRALLRADLPARYRDIDAGTRRAFGVLIQTQAGFAPVEGVPLRLAIANEQIEWHFDRRIYDPGSVKRLQRYFDRFVGVLSRAPETPLGAVSLLDDDEVRLLTQTWNETHVDVDAEFLIHRAIELRATEIPDAVAVVSDDRSLTYGELDARSNQVARLLQQRGVSTGVNVGILTDRSCDMLVAILAVLKSGAAYVPLDPSFPDARINGMLTDAKVHHVVTQSGLRSRLSAASLSIVALDDDAEAIDREQVIAVPSDVTPDDPCYVIYTSGSTGLPKGVVIRHRNVANFFAGMDRVIDHEEPGTWLAVTSLSFDISALELLWTLASGFKIVLHSPDREMARMTTAVRKRPLDFSLFYFSSNAGNPESHGAYDLLIRSVEFADQNGFRAVWTPERHFHAFGGLFPNAAVVSAALATRTTNVQIRAGSCVSPLHHPARIAEEWAVVDNLSNGRVGVGFAAGWQPNDFVLMPQNFGDRKSIMFDQIEQVRSLWRGDTVEFEGHDGQPVAVQTMPRPVQTELPVWITAAGNPETFRRAGEAGFNILTHLLGQSLENVADKIAEYRRGRRAGGHVGPGYVSLMVHTFVHPDAEFARETARQPLKDYLRSAVDLVKDAAWNFPTFKERTIDAAGAFTMEHLAADELDAILEHAFERYYERSGLLGTPEKCFDIVEELRGIGVNDIACLIDFGIDPDVVQAGLQHLRSVVEHFGMATGADTDDDSQAPKRSIAELIHERDVTHLQFTPSMAKLVLSDDATRNALAKLDHVLVGGEPLPTSLAVALRNAVGGKLTNMYGPTETTIWSTSAEIESTDDAPTIGRPIANTRLYIVTSDGLLAAVGQVGELLIGGPSVGAGYFNNPSLTSDRFVTDPFVSDGTVLYKTGDLCRYREDGRVSFVGRSDGQVKIRGYRIELGEIESAVAGLPGVAQAAAAVRPDAAGEPAILAYVLEDNSVALDESAAIKSLASVLPAYMVPSRIIPVGSFPLTPAGKLDRARLPEPVARRNLRESRVAPRDGTEKDIARIWTDLLEIDAVGADDNFFDIGGHSLLAVQAISRLSVALGRELSLIDFFRYPTVRALAEHVGGGVESETRDAVDVGTSRAAARREAGRRRFR